MTVVKNNHLKITVLETAVIFLFIKILNFAIIISFSQL